MPRFDMEEHHRNCPESKLELIDGRLVVGNSLRGSRWTLAELLRWWGPTSAITFAAVDVWMNALAEAFREHDAPKRTASLDQWIEWSERCAFQPTVESAGPRDERLHRGLCQRFRFGLFRKLDDASVGQCYGHGVVMRLGENGFTPDAFIISSRSMSRLHEYYLDGPADVVIEVLLRGHEDHDRVLKREAYARGGVPEYWVVDPKGQLVEYLRLIDGAYQLQSPDSDGLYSPCTMPELSIATNRVWLNQDDLGWLMPHDDPELFQVRPDDDSNSKQRLKFAKGGPVWGTLPFAPSVRLGPSEVTFDEYISWCPEPKFEIIEGKPLIGGSTGTRNMMGLLLQSLGLVEAVRLLRPREWTQALKEYESVVATDAQKREQWWREVRAAAAVLRNEFGIGRIRVIGDLVRDRPLSIWSGVTLVFDKSAEQSSWTLYDKIRDRDKETCIVDLRKVEHLSPAQAAELEARGVEV